MRITNRTPWNTIVFRQLAWSRLATQPPFFTCRHRNGHALQRINRPLMILRKNGVIFQDRQIIPNLNLDQPTVLRQFANLKLHIKASRRSMIRLVQRSIYPESTPDWSVRPFDWRISGWFSNFLDGSVDRLGLWKNGLDYSSIWVDGLGVLDGPWLVCIASFWAVWIIGRLAAYMSWGYVPQLFLNNETLT